MPIEPSQLGRSSASAVGRAPESARGRDPRDPRCSPRSASRQSIAGGAGHRGARRAAFAIAPPIPRRQPLAPSDRDCRQKSRNIDRVAAIAHHAQREEPVDSSPVGRALTDQAAGRFERRLQLSPARLGERSLAALVCRPRWMVRPRQIGRVANLTRCETGRARSNDDSRS